MSTYTCLTCRVVFANGELQKDHYRSDWHRYNLKRKVAEMPPVTDENFKQRVLERKAQIAEQEKDDTVHCTACSKRFSTQNSYENHMKSKKHKEAEAGLQSGKNSTVRVSANGEKETVDQKIAICLARKKKFNAQMNEQGGSANQHQPAYLSEQVKLNKVPQQSAADDGDVSDAESWESDDEEALGVEECLFCSHISTSLEENIKHMTVQHTLYIPDLEYLIDLEGLISYLGEKVGNGKMCLWCNNRGKTFHSIRAVQQHMLKKGHCMILHEGDAVFEYADYYDYRKSYPDYKEGDDVDDDDDDIDVSAMEELTGNGYELVLPSGATIGHKSLMLYYRQNLPARKYTQTKSVLPSLLAQYKALGWVGICGQAAKKKSKDLRYMQRLRAKHHMQLSTKANRMQHHYRSQTGY